MKKNNLLERILIILVTILLISVLFLIGESSRKLILLFLPLVYGFLFLSIAKIHHYILLPGMFMINVISFIRYLILPVLLFLNTSYSNHSVSALGGVKLILYESICLGVFLTILIRKYYDGKKINLKKTLYIRDNLVLKVVIFVAILLVFINPGILSQFNFFFTTSAETQLVSNAEVSGGFSGLVVTWTKFLLPLVLSVVCIKKYYKTNKNIYFYLSVIILMFFNLMIFSGTSRNSAIMPGIASMFFLISIFPKKRNQIFIILSLLITYVILDLTVFKITYTQGNTSMELTEIIDYLEAYFLGPTNYEVSIRTNEIFGAQIDFNTFLNDVFGNFPGISGFFDLENRTTFFFNVVYYNGGLARDQIIPSTGQGLIYFGYFLSIIPQFMMVFIISQFDKFYQKVNEVEILYLISFFAVRFGFMYIQNISIMFSFLSQMIIPLSIIMFFNRIIVKDEKTKYEKNKIIIYN